MNRLFLLPEGRQPGNIYTTETLPVIYHYPYINLLNENPDIATKKETKNVSFNEKVEVKGKDENIVENIVEEIIDMLPGTNSNIPNSNVPNSNIPNSNVQPANANTPNSNGPNTIEGYGNYSGGLNYSDYGN